MTKITLRDYQIIQKNFLEDRIHIADTLAIESGTGSGKTITFLQFVKEWLEKPENHLSNVIISTGFNNLVYLLEERAKMFDLDTRILIGTSALNCPLEMEELGLEYKPFTNDDRCKCGEKHKHLDKSKNKIKKCPFTQDAYQEYYQNILSSVGKVIITNHSSLLLHQNQLTNTSLIIIDEAHTFANFYDSFLKLELDYDDLKDLDRSINKLKEPMKSIIKMNLSKGVDLPRQQIEKICESIEDTTLAQKTREFFETKPDISNFIERTPYSYTIDKFYRAFNFNIKCKKILFSATLDKLTLNMFGVHKTNIYREFKTFCDYSLSEFIAVPNEDYEIALLDFLKYVDDNKLQKGLILSTTINDMNIALKHDGIFEFKFYKDLPDFEKAIENNEKCILVGSRGLFQGIDLPNIDFVCLNKIPFPNWNEKAKAQQDYLTNKGKNEIDPWMDISIPKTENDIVQSTGRLWRSIDSKGIVSIFDHRIEKHKYIIKNTMGYYRHGIKTKIMKDNKIEDFIL